MYFAPSSPSKSSPITDPRGSIWLDDLSGIRKGGLAKGGFSLHVKTEQKGIKAGFSLRFFAFFRIPRGS